MDQNQAAGSPDNDLQRAIDNITNQNNNTNLTSSEPVAAPSSIPEGDSGELGEPVGPFPMPETDSQVGVVTTNPEPLAPIEPLSLPELNVPGENVADAKVVTKSAPNASASDNPLNPTSDSPDGQSTTPDLTATPGSTSASPNEPTSDDTDGQSQPTISNPDHNVAAPAFGTDANNSSDNNPTANNDDTDRPAETPAGPSLPNPSESDQPSFGDNAFGGTPSAPDNNTQGTFGNDSNANSSPALSGDTLEIKKAILKELAPLLERTNADASKKFKIYRDTIEDLHDYSVLNHAYEAASNIQNEDERADSLLYLIESIDSM